MKHLMLGVMAIPFLSYSAIAQSSDSPIAGVPSASLIQLTARSAPQKAIDHWTDSFFYRLHPELGRRKIRSNETQYVNEWAAIEEVVRYNLVYEQICGRGTNFEWLLSHYDGQSRNGIALVSPVLDKIADAAFYARHPELGYRKIQPGETGLTREWMRIRQTVSELHPCD